MCSSIRINNLFGRNMDLDYSFNECIIITPSLFPLTFKKIKTIEKHYKILGIGTIINNYPLYADAMNEHGLAFAALNFPNNAKYYKEQNTKINLAPYELCLYLLAKYKTIKEIKEILNNINIINIDFNKETKNTPLHFMFSDSKESIVIEPLEDGMKVYDNLYDILTNNPPFIYHKYNLINYLNLHNKDIINTLNPDLNFKVYSYGLGAFGLPGDYSSSSRFIKGYFVKNYLDLSDNIIHQFFKCLDSISMIKGVVETNLGYEYTRYTSCYDLNNFTLYYKTYFSYEIKKISLDSNDEYHIITIKL